VETGKIAEIQGFLLRYSLPEAQGNASGFYGERSALLVKLLDRDGKAGWGEAWHSPEAAAAVIRASLAPVVLNQPPAEYGRLWEAMVARLGYDRRGGVGLMAVSAIDMALWDLRARQLEVPISTLLGGARREKVFAYAAGPYFRPSGNPYRSYSEEARLYVRDGFRALKIKVGVRPEVDAQAVADIRHAVGPDVAIMVDVNQGYRATGAAEAARAMEKFGVTWIEEPVEPDDNEGYARVGRSTSIAVAGGEALGGTRAFDTFLREGAPDILQPDLSVCGGFTEAVRIAALADTRGRAVVPHVWGTAVNFYASLQWAAALGDCRGPGPLPYPWFEFDRSPNPLRELAGPPALPDTGGQVTAPRGPGLGVEVSPDALALFTVERWVVNSP
jgi:D-galactarolactone cycloisomerase